jgi:hypothetical protein
MKRSALLLSLAYFLLLPAQAPARPPQEVIDELCLSHLFAGASKLGRDTVKQLGKCHSQRLNGQLPAATDCNQESSAPWADLRQRNAISLHIRARKRCDVPPASSPASLGFTACPAPCDAEVPAIATYADVAGCLVCQTYRIAENLSTAVFGTPTLPAGTEEPCWARLTRAVRHYIGVVLRAQRTCQTAKDKGKLPPATDCRTYDPHGRVAVAVELIASGVAYCTDSDLAALDSCGETVTEEQMCLEDEINAATSALFDAVY